jgi:hypothetical protein
MQQGAKLGVVSPHRAARLAAAVPIRPELEARLDFGYHKPRRRLTRLMRAGMAPSYPTKSLLSRGRRGRPPRRSPRSAAAAHDSAHGETDIDVRIRAPRERRAALDSGGTQCIG